MTTNRLPDTVPQYTRQSFILHSALGLLAGISVASVWAYLLGRRDRARRMRQPVSPVRTDRSPARRAMVAGIELLPLLLPLILESEHKRKPAATATPPKPRTARRIGAYILPILLCLALGGLAGWLQRPALAEWYPTLLKPAGTPPNWLFPVAWCILYILMGISAGRRLTSSNDLRGRIMTIWGIQLGINFLWSILFFVVRSPLSGMLAIVVLDAFTILYIVRSYPIQRDAAWLFVPYLVWLLYATYLNGWILFANNPGI